jgi:hypothetical protein
LVNAKGESVASRISMDLSRSAYPTENGFLVVEFRVAEWVAWGLGLAYFQVTLSRFARARASPTFTRSM